MPSNRKQWPTIVITMAVAAMCIGVLMAYFFYIAQSGVVRHKYGDYEVVEIKGVLTPQECDALVADAQKRNMEPSQVVSQGEGEYVVKENNRKSYSLWMKDSDHAVAEKMAQTAHQWTRLPINHQELLQIVKYDVGGKFIAHHDTQYGSFTQSRKATLLVYLNDDYEGGATHFVKLGLKIRPEKGKGILFYSLDDANKIIDVSQHSGEKVERGNKWICTKWIHNVPFSPQ